MLTRNQHILLHKFDLKTAKSTKRILCRTVGWIALNACNRWPCVFFENDQQAYANLDVFGMFTLVMWSPYSIWLDKTNAVCSCSVETRRKVPSWFQHGGQKKRWWPLVLQLSILCSGRTKTLYTIGADHITACSPYTAVDWRRSSFSCRRWPHLERSAAPRHARIISLPVFRSRLETHLFRRSFP